ncbi:hypothetical protein [Rhizobium mongolense]|uniref:Lipoprotein n=2 Tax=Rhizobium mongolense TaxID=57676 RepID=A0ABR6IRJ3_9HYPH|nr:hypothetical protein [Rhizobium mongolense]MBB4230507.1 hypothetical protein [Rhizobium mongolense]TVZ65423.1 hypothetical protein BCL32_5728 [Rhizobium mongolense USDA 1844]
MKASTQVGISMMAVAVILAGCVTYADKPVLYPVGSPVNPPFVAHVMCIGEANAMYGEAMQQYKLRAQMTRDYDSAEAEALSRGAARRQYDACASSEGYRAVYDR